MSQVPCAGDERPAQSKEYEGLLSQVHLLLDHLQRINDNRLLAQFEDTRSLGLEDARARVAARTPIVAIPPCKKYADFVMRLVRMKSGSMSDEESGDPKLSDPAFLRWSLDFLAALAEPASAETVAMTRAYIGTRVRWANDSWCQWGNRVLEWLCHPPASGPESEWSYDERVRRSAMWLARSVSLLESLTIVFGIAAVVLSAYAMVGRLVVNDESSAFAAFSKTREAVDKDRRILASPTYLGLDRELQFEGVDVLKQKAPPEDCPRSFNWRPFIKPRPPITFAATKPAQFADPDPTNLAQDMVAQCTHWQWNLMALMNDNVRLRGWENVTLVVPGLKAVVGWDRGAIEDLGSMLRTDFCDRLTRAYSYDKMPTAGACSSR